MGFTCNRFFQLMTPVPVYQDLLLFSSHLHIMGDDKAMFDQFFHFINYAHNPFLCINDIDDHWQVH